MNVSITNKDYNYCDTGVEYFAVDINVTIEREPSDGMNFIKELRKWKSMGFYIYSTKTESNGVEIVSLMKTEQTGTQSYHLTNDVQGCVCHTVHDICDYCISELI